MYRSLCHQHSFAVIPDNLTIYFYESFLHINTSSVSSVWVDLIKSFSMSCHLLAITLHFIVDFRYCHLFSIAIPFPCSELHL